CTSLGVLDRMVYPSVEPFAALSAAAAVTTRARLVTMVVIGPLRNTALLAKQAASLALPSAGAPPPPGARGETMGVSGPLRNTALLAKQAASLDLLSAGRLTLGLAIGARSDDYQALGVDPAGRGRRLGEQLAELRSLWEQGEVGPEAVQPGGPPLLAGRP